MDGIRQGEDKYEVFNSKFYQGDFSDGAVSGIFYRDCLYDGGMEGRQGTDMDAQGRDAYRADTATL